MHILMSSFISVHKYTLKFTSETFTQGTLHFRAHNFQKFVIELQTLILLQLSFYSVVIIKSLQTFPKLNIPFQRFFPLNTPSCEFGALIRKTVEISSPNQYK